LPLATDPDRADFLITGGDQDVVAQGNATSATIQITIPAGESIETRVVDVFTRDAGSSGILNVSCGSESGSLTIAAHRDPVQYEKNGVTIRQAASRRMQEALSIHAHPNPVHGEFTIEVNRKVNGTQTILLTSAVARVYERICDPIPQQSITSFQIDLKDIPSGVYFVCLNLDNETSCESIIIY
jgi:hypothetical protein